MANIDGGENSSVTGGKTGSADTILGGAGAAFYFKGEQKISWQGCALPGSPSNLLNRG